MSMNKNSSTSYSPVKSVLFVLGLLALLVSTEFAAVHGRALRSMTADNVVIKRGCEEQGEAGDETVGRVPSSAVSANNSSRGRNSFESLVFRLASGPSKRGPGH